jgi:hypothetical protein
LTVGTGAITPLMYGLARTAHAGMALGAADLKLVHTHLHHVINCLVGPSGKGFDAQAEHGVKAATLDDAHADAQQVLTSLQEK